MKQFEGNAEWDQLCEMTSKLFAEFGSRSAAMAEARRRRPDLAAAAIPPGETKKLSGAAPKIPQASPARAAMAATAITSRPGAAELPATAATAIISRPGAAELPAMAATAIISRPGAVELQATDSSVVKIAEARAAAARNPAAQQASADHLVQRVCEGLDAGSLHASANVGDGHQPAWAVVLEEAAGSSVVKIAEARAAAARNPAAQQASADHLVQRVCEGLDAGSLQASANVGDGHSGAWNAALSQAASSSVVKIAEARAAHAAAADRAQRAAVGGR